MTVLARRVYALLSTVPPGRVTTYKALADAAGTRSYRAVGQLMKHNPDAPTIPCHRVVAANGTIGGFMGKTAGTYIKKKKSLLQREGICFRGYTIIDFKKYLYPLR